MAQPDPRTAALTTGIAAELRRVRIELERMAEILVGDAHFVATYLDQLQVFDFLGQCADESAALIERLAEGVDPDAAAAEVRLDIMLGRLRKAMAVADAPPQAQAA